MSKPLLTSPISLRGLRLRNRVVISPIGRQVLFDPNWALHAEVALGVEGDFASWPVQAGWWLDKRQRSLAPQDAAAALKRAAVS